MPYKDGVWYEPEEWAKIKAERKLLNKQAFQEAKKSLPKAEARAPVSTKEGQRQRVQQFKELLLSDSNGNRVVGKVLEVAMNDNHPGQMAALKLCMDRMLPTSLFEDAKKDGGRAAIQINITGLNDANVENIVEGEVVERD